MTSGICRDRSRKSKRTCHDYQSVTPVVAGPIMRATTLIAADRTFAPGPCAKTVRTTEGEVMVIPTGWALVPSGDTVLTRRVKAAGDHWVVQKMKGPKVTSRAIWAPRETIERIRVELDAERLTASYVRKKRADVRRRERAQAIHIECFNEAILMFLAFRPPYADLANRLARAVTDHASSVGSGTDARTNGIPIEQRAEAAVIAWLRHQKAAYDRTSTPKVKGKQPETRQLLAGQFRELLDRYRRGNPALKECPLQKALESSPHTAVT